MIVTGHCTACGDFTRIDHRTGLCDWCEGEADRVSDPLWDDDSPIYFGHSTRRADHAL